MKNAGATAFAPFRQEKTIDKAEILCYTIRELKKYRGIEQLEARRAHNPEAGGSSPPPATRKDTHPSGWVFFFMPEKRTRTHLNRRNPVDFCCNQFKNWLQP